MALIGISPCRKLEDYRQAVLHVGGSPQVLDLATPVEQALSGLGGLLLTGGDDVAPSRYGEAAHPTVVEAETGRDEFEIALINAARARKLPILAICRGVQVLNVACGGSLIQDIPTELPLPLNHRVPTPPNASAHEVHVSAGTSLAALLGMAGNGGHVTVNSRHHQAPQRSGEGLIVIALPEHAVVEALVLTDHPFCVGVQWHPENFVETGELQSQFNGLIEAARGRM